MNLFSSDRYTKPGKGVEKDEKPKPAFIRFFITLWNKKYSLIGINFIYVIFNILAFALAAGIFVAAVGLYDVFNTDFNLMQMVNEQSEVTDLYFRFLIFFAVFTTSLPVFAVGPFQAGFTFILKSFNLEQPCFLFHDFITKSRSNLGLSIKYSIINCIAGCLTMLNGAAYFVIADPNNTAYNTTPWFIMFIFAAIIFFFAVLITMISIFAYPMMVIFNVNLKQLLKNCFTLVLIKWLPSLGIMILDGAIIALPVIFLPSYNYILYVVVLALYVTLTPGVIGLINNFYVYPIFKKYLIDNPNADKSEHNDSNDGNNNENEAVTAGGRFENGRWINDGED